MTKVDYLLRLQNLMVSFDFKDDYFNKDASYFAKRNVNSELEKEMEWARYKCAGSDYDYYMFLSELSEIPFCRGIDDYYKKIIKNGAKKFKKMWDKQEDEGMEM